MATNKKSFILYADQINLFEILDDHEAGRLIKHIFRYINDQNPEPIDRMTKISFEPIKQQLKRDLSDWEATKHGRSESGKIGGIKSGEVRRSKMKQNEAKRSTASKNEANEAVNVNVNVNDNVNVRERESPKLFSIEHCMTIALNDERWVKANKANELQLKTFNSFLEQTGEYEKNPGDYKKHFANLKLKNPEKFKTNGKANYKAALQAFRGES